MSRDESYVQVPPTRFFVELFGLGCTLSFAFILFKAPVWVVYISPVIAVPLLLRELRHLDRREGLKRQKSGAHTGSDVESLAADLEEMRMAARQARSRKELESVRLRQVEFERSRLRYERWALAVGIAWAIVAVALSVLAVALSWQGQIPLFALPAVVIVFYLLKSRAFGEGHRLWASVDREIGEELKMQEFRMEREPDLGSVHSNPRSSQTSRPDSP